MKTADPNITRKFQLIKDVSELFRIEHFPYQVKASVGPLIEYWKGEVDSEKYMRHLHDLIEEQYIEGQIENLEQNTLQGVYGLKALSVTVKLTS